MVQVATGMAVPSDFVKSPEDEAEDRRRQAAKLEV